LAEFLVNEGNYLPDLEVVLQGNFIATVSVRGERSVNDLDLAVRDLPLPV
jgi:hypothetical protein